ncbi:unnamed protein product [Fraxinus pennsylvanica]|uniref:Uncharacterized protein n=1 Tax=Fraxinus pennsylvanica TaxID=56036 RepID=A0AAD2A6V0_9LAMI|nr:unnamed protein product [Fraxinus pennsylvanica]
MEDKSVTIPTRNFMKNRLLSKKQFIIGVLHPGRPNVSKLRPELEEKLKRMQCEVKDPNSIFVFKIGLNTKVEKSRKQPKERKKTAIKIRGLKKTNAAEASKKK